MADENYKELCEFKSHDNKVWSSLLLKQNKKWSSKSSAKFQVFAVKSENNTINRMEDLPNLDLTPFTDKIIAEYIWHMFFLKRHLLSNINSSFFFWNNIQTISQTHQWHAKDYAIKLCKKLTAKIETPKTICFNSKTQSMLYNHDIEVRSNINCWKWISI